MEVTITNQASYPLICTLNSGQTIHLAPSETSGPLRHLEINGNEKIEKLVRAGLVSIATQDIEEERSSKETRGTEERTAAPAARRQRKQKE